MQGLMMDYQLTVPSILVRAKQVFAEKEIVSVMPSGKKHRTTYGDLHDRVLRLMGVLKQLGVKQGDRVATFAWNHYRHLELYYGMPCMGAVLHTLNIRLSPEQLEYIVNHAEDQVIFVDASLVKALEPLAAKFKSVKQYVIITEDGKLPETTLKPVVDYEALMAKATPERAFPELEENLACGLCYTSGTTGNPKGVLYSHRSTYLHSLLAMTTDVLRLSESDTVLPVVPMFHANAWGQPFACAMTGAKLVFAGSDVSPQNIVGLIQSERVTLAAGVPTIWNALLQYLREKKPDLGRLNRMVVGGSAVPKSMIMAFKNEFHVDIIQGWGMTEMSPLGTTGRLKTKAEDWSADRQFDALATAGLPCPGVEMKVVDALSGKDLPWDGKSVGELLVRGPAIVKAYYNNPEANAKQFTDDGWFRTGDVAYMDPDAYLHIADRTKDLIKSGGEWISSVEMENAVMAMPGILEAAVVARPDPKWDERPVVFAVRQPGSGTPGPQDIVTYLSKSFAKWQLPSVDDVHFIEQVPRTSVGKFDKKVLRAEFKRA
ncbi:MAG TPA: long-chain fatty acid--CoA ligase [bacterium]